MESKNNCCNQKNESRKGGLIKGFLYGLVPHSFCIGFIVFSIIGVTTATAFFRKFLLNPYFFYILIGVSFLLATVSALIYLKSSKCLCAQGIKSKWKYISILYASTVLTNLLMFLVIFPAVANINPGAQTQTSNLSSLSLEVQIPCSGHAPLIIDELKTKANVDVVNFKMPDIFEIKYNPEKTSLEKITALDIFKVYKAKLE